MDQAQAAPSQNPSPQHVPEKYLIAFVIQGDDVFKITADNIIHTIGTADGPAFDAIAKLKAAAALLELTNRHKERPDELRKMARELAGEGMKLMARASSSIRPMPAPHEETSAPMEEAKDHAEHASVETETREEVPPVFGPRVASSVSAFFETVHAQGPVPRPEERTPGAPPLPVNSRIALISS
jgi:hypothetical protein